MRILNRLALSVALLGLWNWNGLAQSSTITTYAGPFLPVSGSPATTQTIGIPDGVIADGAGGFYVSSSSQNRVYRVTSDGTLTVIAGNGRRGFGGDGGPASSAVLKYPHGVAADGAGNVFIADTNNNRVRMVTPHGVITTVAGTGGYGSSGDGGPAASASLGAPRGVAVDQAGNLFIADSDNNRIRMVTPGGVITTVAGSGPAGSDGDGGPALAAQLHYPVGVAVDGAGNLFIADRYNNRIRKVTADGIISTVISGRAGLSGDGGPAASAQINDPRSVAVDRSGNIFIADSGNERIRMVTPDGIIYTVAGSSPGFGGDGGAAVSARLGLPVDVSVDAAGNLFIADRGNYRVRHVAPTGVINTVAGTSDDGGPAWAAQLNSPTVLAVDGAGNLFIADSDSQRVRKVTAAGIITTVAGNGAVGFSGDGGPPTSAELNYPGGVAADAAGNIFIADTRNHRIRKVTPAGIITTIAGNGATGFSGDGGPATSARLSYPWTVAVDGSGNMFIADTGNHSIRKVDAAGIITTVAGIGTKGFSGDGGPATSAQLANPSGVSVDGAGNLLIADSSNNRIRRVTPDGAINTVAGDGVYGSGGDGGPATGATLAYPNGVVADAAGNLFVADTDNQRIRKISSAGVISTVAGNGTHGFGGDGGAPSSAQLASPYGVAFDGTNTLYIADLDNGRIRKVVFTVTPFTITDRGGTSIATPGASMSLQTGYGRIQARPGNTTPQGLAIFSYRSGNYLISETGVPATATSRSGRIYAEVNGPVDTGLAIANPNNQTATVNFLFTDAMGNNLASGTTTIGANQQIARFLDSDPFKTFAGASFQGTFSFTSDIPVGAIAIRGLINERQNFLMSTLPVVDTSVAPNTGTVVVPHFTDGGDWTTQILLVNPTASPLTGSVEFHDNDGALTNVTIGTQTGSTFSYAVAPNSSQKIVTAGGGPVTARGSVRITPADGTGIAPVPLIIFSYKPGGTVTVSEAGVPAVSGTAFRVYAESSGNPGQAGVIQSGIAIANDVSTPASVTLELSNLDGSTTGLPAPVSYTLAGFGHIDLFLAEAFAGLPNPFKGILRVSTASSGISAVGLRTRYNERGDFLITTTPPVNELTPPTSAEFVLPHLADGNGYTTQLILFSGAAGQSASGSLMLFQQSGQPLTLTLR